MADNIPLFPTETNVETFRDFVNLQKELNDHLMAERHLYEQIGRVSLDVESRVVQRRNNEFNMMKQIRDKMLEVNILTERRANTIGTERDELERVIKATLEDIKHTRNLIAMSREANDIEMAMTKKIHEENNRWFNFASKKLNDLFGMKVKEFDITEGIGEELLKQGIRGEALAYTFGAILMMLKGAYTTFLAFDKAAWEFRKAMGMTRDEAQVIRQQAERMTIDFMHLGVTIDGAYKSFQALGKVFGGIHNVSKSVAENVALMAAQLEISEETSAGFLRNLAAVSKNTIESQQYMMGFAQAMATAGGIPLGDVMKDVATKSSTTLTMMSRLPNVVLKSAIELRRMGTSLDSASKSSRHILDFTENINEEMEASVLLGRSINLQRARELAYRRDLEGSQKEILRITKSINFEKLDVFQQEAYAKATGKSVEELLNMLQTDRQIEKVRRSGTPEAQKQLKLYEDMHKANVANAKAIGNNVEASLRQKANQERIVAIQNKWNQLLVKAQEFLFPIIDKLLAGALALTSWAPRMMLFINPLASGLGFLSKWIGKSTLLSDIFLNMTIWVGKFGSKFAFIEKILLAVGEKVGAIVGWLAKSFGFAGKFLGFFGKLLGPIGWVITAFQAIGGFIHGWNSTTGNWLQKLGGGVMGALRNIIPGFDYIVKAIKWVWGWAVKIYHVLTDWFNPIGLIIRGMKSFLNLVGNVKDKIAGAFHGAWSKVKKLWGGHSPSEAGLSILRGISSVTPMMAKALQNPFKTQFDMVKKLMPMMGKVIMNSPLGLLFGAGRSIEAKVKAAYFPAVSVTPQGTKLATGIHPKKPGEKEEKDTSQPMSEDTGQEIVALLKKLVDKDVGVNIDGSKLSTFLARNVEFRGSFGTNR